MRSRLEKEDFPCQVLRCVWRYLDFAYKAEQGLCFFFRSRGGRGWIITRTSENTIELKSFMSLQQKKCHGKTRVHLMEMSFKDNGKFVSLLEFSHNRNKNFSRYT